MAYINVDEVYILDNTGLQVDMATDIPFADAGFSDAQKEQARANIGAGGTNPNLLDNPWWGSGEVVNQRGVTSGSVGASTYVMDRWKSVYSGSGSTFSITASGINVTVAGTYVYYMQQFEDATRFNGKTLTASVMLGDGTVESGTIIRSNGTAQVPVNTGDIALVMQTDNSFRVILYTSMTIRAVKLELGSVSTLANDTPPDYGTELAKCQYYFRRIASISGTAQIAYGYAVATTAARFIVPATMRHATLSPSFSGVQVGLTSTPVNVTAISASQSTDFITLTCTASGLNGSYFLYIAQNGYIDISADL